MEQKTKKLYTAVVWGVWILAAVLLVLVVVLVASILRQGGVVESQQPKQELQQAPTEQTPEEQEQAPAVEYPVLDLEPNPYGPDDFDFRGRYLECTAGACAIGVDVSYWQGEINWPLVKAAGMEFAMIRLGWRGNTEGNIGEDSTAAVNYRGAKDAGMQVGGYFFSQAVTAEEAVEEAEFVLEMIKDWKMDMPIVFDWEDAGGTRPIGMDPRTLTDCAKAFCETIENAGYEAMVYTNWNQAFYDLYLEELSEYGLWLAMYEAEMEFPYKIDMWQYSCTGSVPGVEGPVDLNIYFQYE